MTHRLAVTMPDALWRALSDLRAAHPYLRQHALLRLALRVGLAEIASLEADEVRARAAAEIALSGAAAE